MLPKQQSCEALADNIMNMTEGNETWFMGADYESATNCPVGYKKALEDIIHTLNAQRK